MTVENPQFDGPEPSGTARVPQSSPNPNPFNLPEGFPAPTPPRAEPIGDPMTPGGSVVDPLPAGVATDPVVLTIGDIGVSSHWVVTPNGTAPLRGSQWMVTDQTVTQSKIPTWAIICAIVFALLCLIGLLFLLVKEKTTTGYVQVMVRSGDLLHSTQIPVSNEYAINHVRSQVSQAQRMAAAA